MASYYGVTITPGNEAAQIAKIDADRAKVATPASKAAEAAKTAKIQQDLVNTYSGTNKVKAQAQLDAYKATQISTPAPAPSGATAPTTPTPSAPGSNASYMSSSTSSADASRKALEDAYKKQIADKDKKIEASNIAIAGITSKQKGIIENDVNPLLQPFREDLEKSERERLSVEKNFADNQKLTEELDTLLTEGNQLIEEQRNVTGLDSIRSPRIQKSIDTVAARAGVIQAVMAARNGQIAQAENMIDRSVAAITADKNDRLTYFNTLLDFYENSKDDEGKKLFQLEADKKEYVNAQIGQLEDDVTRAKDNADYIKKLMVNPESAAFMANAGVTLNDSPEVVQQKIGAQAQRQEVEDIKNEYASSGYTYVPFPSDTAGLVSVEANGSKMWFKPPTLSETSVGGFRVLRDSSGKIISTRSPDEGGGLSGATDGFASSKIESDIRADASTLLDKVDSSQITLDQAFNKLRLLYSPTEATDEALQSLLGVDDGTPEVAVDTSSAPNAEAPYGWKVVGGKLVPKTAEEAPARKDTLSAPPKNTSLASDIYNFLFGGG